MAIWRGSPLLHVEQTSEVGPVVVLLHGVASSSVTFQNVVPLIEETHRVIAIDLLGFGQSPIVTDIEYTIDDHVAAIEHTVKSLKLRSPFTLVGHSMGALIAARMGARDPHRFTKLVLVSPPIYISPQELSRALDRRVMDFYLRAYEYIRLNKEFTLRNAKIVESMLSIPKAMDINENNWVPFVKSLQNSIESQTTISDLANVAAPIEIVYGDLDEFHSEGVLHIVSRMTGVTLHRVRGSDHLIGKRLARVVATAIG
ncbi:MAG TPA: alpha/beta hydrolase [Galbitalea sp.]|jgi:pimeloyl-ACP methyl ester carboxylesterase